MKHTFKQIVANSILKFIQYIKDIIQLRILLIIDQNRFSKYSINAVKKSDSFEQLEAKIIKTYHSIEKGLSQQNVKLGFGTNKLDELLFLISLYSMKGYSLREDCYQSAISTILIYIKIHEKHNFDVSALKNRMLSYHDNDNKSGGYKTLKKEDVLNGIKGDFQRFSESRHSIRCYSNKPVDMEKIFHAIDIAQNTPSACNRQAWNIKVVKEPELKKIIIDNQNGNKGFGESIDKILLVTTDVQYFYSPRERNQAYIDGGLYSMNLLYSLHFEGIATVPLSASLSRKQAKIVRNSLGILKSENLILFIGLGNYLDEFKITKSSRHHPRVSVH